MVDPSVWRWIAKTLRFGHGNGPQIDEPAEVVVAAERIVANVLRRPREWSDPTRDRHGYDRAHRLGPGIDHPDEGTGEVPREGSQ